MEFLDIVKRHGKIDGQRADTKLIRLGNLLFENEWVCWDNFSSYMKVTVPNEKCHVTIGTHHLYCDCESSEVNKAGYVLTVAQMYHEYRHIQQFTTEHKLVHEKDLTSNDRRMTDIVRRHFVCNWYRTLYGNTYATDPGEMDAEAYGIEKALTYFSKDPMVSQAEAGDILFQFMLSKEYGHEQKLRPYGVESIEDVSAAFKDLRQKTIHIPYQITTMESPEISVLKRSEPPDLSYDLAYEFLNSYKYKQHRLEFEKCNDGRMQDKILEQTIIMKNPHVITEIPRLEKELRVCQHAMKSRIFVSKNDVIPATKIQYTNSQMYEDFTEAVNSIPMDFDTIDL